ncbi:Hypothetical protein, putative [Bodo saltans]|uniref:Uncharacterized protein n=1 Tax=Bodo saltans TaxID=75058 RepID=A0A0S4IKA6_BODSA|nr:Hypothetical protein, putative [Bodo saltans]|eukprot:CUF04637.1 Hypothetical protein, putative [Bodo saltans]
MIDSYHTSLVVIPSAPLSGAIAVQCSTLLLVREGVTLGVALGGRSRGIFLFLLNDNFKRKHGSFRARKFRKKIGNKNFGHSFSEQQKQTTRRENRHSILRSSNDRTTDVRRREVIDREYRTSALGFH